MGRGVGRGVGRAVALFDSVLVGTGVKAGARVACKILLCRSPLAGARAAFPRKNRCGTTAGADASIITDVPVWPNQTSRPINNRGMGFLVLLFYDEFLCEL